MSRFNMKYWFSALLILVSFISPGQTKLDLKKDFKAKGDGKTDDTKAFLMAAERINKLKANVTLFIPAGTYIVRPQKASPPESTTPFFPVDLLYLKDCKNISIGGEKGTLVRYSAGLYFGAFQRKGKGKGFEKMTQRTTDWKYRVAVGHGFNLENCNNIKITSIEMDGNNRSFSLGGEFGDVGMQIDNDGVFMKDCSNITLSNLNLHHFGRDGILILNKTPQQFNTPSQHIALNNCRFEYNGRQGLSWCGGSGLVATGCSFSFTGKSKFSSPPGAGVDFEPNGGYIVKDGVFNNCTFRNNNGVSVLADQGGFSVTGIQFNNCSMSGEESPAIWVKSPSFTFADCKINGAFYFGCAARNAAEGTKFLRCTFTDINSKNNYLVESNGSKYLLFDNCTFRAATNGLLYIAADATKPEERAVVKDCRLVSTYKASAKAGAFTTGVDFTGNTSFIDSGKVRVGWNLENSRFTEIKCKEAKIRIGSNFMLASYNEVVIGANEREAKVHVVKNGLLSINNNARLIIGPEGKLVIEKGAALWIAPGAELIVKGKIVAEEGAYLCIHREAKLSSASRENIKIEGKVNYADNPQMKFGLSGCITVGK